MPYLIDGNNVAGKLDMLDEPGFDTRLVYMLVDYCETNGKHAIVVFDSNDILGDRFSEGPVTVIYTPRDAVYANADDKIIELMRSEKKPQDWVVVTDDTAILDEADDLGIETVSAREFARRLIRPERVSLDDEERELESDLREEINDDLLDEWSGETEK